MINNLIDIPNSRILVTGGAGFICSNICEELLSQGANVVCLDNFSTGNINNILNFINHPNFKLIIGDIRNIKDCEKAVNGIDFVFHEAALGSVPRSIDDPVTSNEVNVSGFLNMLYASKNAQIRRFIYAASSSTYGDSEALPKVEDIIGNPLSPYAITKYVNELYADVFSRTYGIETIGLRYFNVFGRRQNPHGAYAAVIPTFVKQFMEYESPIINGDGNYSRDFTYIDNVIQMNLLALLTINPNAINTVYNTACGDRTTIKQLVIYLQEILGKYDSKIENVNIIYGPKRVGDIPHSMASIQKAEVLLGYKPKYSIKDGLMEAIKWYWNNL